MPYGLRILFEHTDHNGNDHRIEINEREYSGSYLTREMDGADPAIPTWGDSSNSIPLIYGSELVLKFITAAAAEFQFLFTADARKYRVDHYFNQSLYWSGFISPDQWSEPLTAPPYTVEATATDGLATLKDREFTTDDGEAYTGRKTLLAIAALCLARTGLNLPVNVAVSLVESQQTAGTNYLAGHTANCERFADKTCYEILQQICPTCRIFQRLGQWWIIDYRKFKADTLTYSSYSAAGLLVSSGNTISLLASGYWIENEPSIDVEAAVKKLKVNQDFGYNENVIENGDFEKYNSTTDTFKSWENISITPQQYTLNADGDKFVYLPGKQYPDSFDHKGYGLITQGIKKQLDVAATNSVVNLSMKYALLGDKYGSLMFIGVRLIGATHNYYLRRTPYVDKEQEFSWRIYDGTELMGEDHITLGSNAKPTKSNIDYIDGEIVVVKGKYYNTYNNVPAYPLKTIKDHFENFTASVNGIPETGTIEIYLYVPYTNRAEITGSCFTGVSVKIFDEENNDYDASQLTTVTADENNNYTPDDIELIIGDVPDITNANIIYSGALFRTDGTISKLWHTDDSSTLYAWSAIIGRMMTAIQSTPRQNYQIRMQDLTPGLNMIIEDEGRRLLESGISYDTRMQAVEGQYIEIIETDIDLLTSETDNKKINPDFNNIIAKTSVQTKTTNTEERVVVMDTKSAKISAPGYMDADYFDGQEDEETGYVRIKSLKRLIATNPIEGHTEPMANGNNSVAIGEGATANAFREIVLGSFAPELAGTADSWLETDRLFVLGNGADAANPRAAMEVFKSGFVILYNALKLGKYQHGQVSPANGTLQFDENKLQLAIEGIWKILLTDAPSDTHAYGRKDGAWINIDGVTPHIGANGNWYIGTTDTGIAAQGPAGANGADGTNGADGVSPNIGANGNWFIGATDTGIAAQGPAGANGADGTNGADGVSPNIGANGNWYIGATDTGIAAQGPAGANGAQGPAGSNGVGIPAGGQPGQKLRKKSTNDYDTEWVDDSGISHAVQDDQYYASRNGYWTALTEVLAAKAALAGSISQQFSASQINLPNGGYITCAANGSIHLYPGASGEVVVHGQVTADSFYKN